MCVLCQTHAEWMPKLHDKRHVWLPALWTEHLISVYTQFIISSWHGYRYSRRTVLRLPADKIGIHGSGALFQWAPWHSYDLSVPILLLDTAIMLPVFDHLQLNPPKLIPINRFSGCLLLLRQISASHVIPQYTDPASNFSRIFRSTWLNLVMPISSHGPTTGSPVVLSKSWLFYESWMCSS